MGKEIERKYLVHNIDFLQGRKGEKLVQAYLANTDRCVVRVRIKTESAYLTIKSNVSGMTRDEYEYPIPVKEAASMIASFGIQPTISKTRYIVPYAGNQWEVDVFDGDNQGLVVAEIELRSESQAFSLPEWVAEEVTADRRYYNAALVSDPYVTWAEND